MAAVGARRHQKTHSTAKGADDSKGIWSSLLDSVATGKKLAEKSLLILGGTAESQKDFLDALSNDNSQARRGLDRTQSKQPPIANRFALGYTYQDILDADQDDILARLSLYLLSDRDDAFSNLLEPLFTPETISNTLVVVLLDWNEPWSWARQLRDWIRILRTALSRLDNDCAEAMDENMKLWTERKKGHSPEGAASAEGEVPVTLGPGEWDEPLGIPICCVAQGAERTEALEREHGWKDDEFDFILQFMRTVLLKHGGSLIYTASSAPGQLHTLIRSSLSIHSLLQRNPLKHNVIDRDKILVPPNWDSWGKIRPLGENFDIEGTSGAWSVEIQPDPPSAAQKRSGAVADEEAGSELEAVSKYEKRIEDPTSHQSSAMQLGANRPDGVETTCQDTQDFLASQFQVLEKLRAEDEKEQKAREAKRVGNNASAPSRGESATPTGSRVNEHLGPVQFNMGGIQVDAEDAVKKLQDAGRSSGDASKGSSPEPALENEKLSSFFAGLMNRGSTPAAGSPRHDSSRD